MSDFPISQLYELNRLPQAGDDVTIAPERDDLARIAQWADIEAIDAFQAKIALRKMSASRFALDVTLTADIVQNCVVTLDPLRSHIERVFTRELILTQVTPRPSKIIDVEPAPVDEDGREEIESLRYDLAVPVLEEFALAIDPYPRAPGVEFDPPAEDADSPVHPFAALKGLKSPP
jgi:hypothetical protein